jgi:hypothetical protein
MKRLLLALALLTAAVALIGFTRGWFRVSADRGADTTGVTLTVDREKVRIDRDKAVDTARAAGHEAKSKAATAAATH